MQRIPVTLVTGYLGSGKTTLLNRLLRDPAMAGAAVIINEVGEVGVDHHLVSEVADDIVLLESGCLCCTVRGDLARSLRDLFMRRLQRQIGALERVIIETSGLADPAPVLYTLLHDFFLAERFVLEGLLCTVDAQHIDAQLERRPEVLRQLAMADRLIITKTDLVSAEQAAASQRHAQAINPTASVLRADAPVMDLLADLSAYDPAAKPAQVRTWLGDIAAEAAARRVQKLGVLGAYGLQAPSVVHEASVSTEVLRFEEAFAWGDFVEAFDVLQDALGDRILRVKGLVKVVGQSGPRIVHAVGHERYPTQDLAQWPDADQQTRLVFIVENIPRAALEQAFSQPAKRSAP